MSNSEPHILVTGGAGYIGSHTVIGLRDSGKAVVVLDNLSSGSKALVPDDVPMIVGDIKDTDLVRRTLERYAVSAVMHFAGSIIVSESVADPLAYYTNNTEASLRFISCCHEMDVDAFVFSSTAAVYGDPAQRRVDETAPTMPINPYGASKLMTERMLRDVSAATGLRIAILRYFNVAGADPMGRSGQIGPNTSHLIRTAAEVASGARSYMEIFGTDYDTPDGTCIRDFIHVSDLATAHIRALDYLLETRENLLLNCGYGTGYSVREVLLATQTLADKPLDIREACRRLGDAAELVSDSRQIREILSWTPAFDDISLIIKTALDWEKRKAALNLS